MVYLSHFEFPDIEEEYSFTMSIKRTCYDSFYPFQVLSKHQLSMLDFEPVTILYGGNGSGKTTVLNRGRNSRMCVRIMNFLRSMKMIFHRYFIDEGATDEKA